MTLLNNRVYLVSFLRSIKASKLKIGRWVHHEGDRTSYLCKMIEDEGLG